MAWASERTSTSASKTRDEASLASHADWLKGGGGDTSTHSRESRGGRGQALSGIQAFSAERCVEQTGRGTRERRH
jgi:hypothetical protein